MVNGSRLSSLLLLLAATALGNTDGGRLCLYGFVSFDGKYQEKLELRKAAGRCLCFYEIVCKDPNDADCRIVKHLEFGCDKERQGDDPQTSTILKGHLKIHFDIPAAVTTTTKKRGETYSVASEIMVAKETFLNRLAIVRRNGPNDVVRARMARRMVKMWAAGLFSVNRQYPGGDGRVHFDSDLAWLPLATSAVLLVISVVFFVKFRNYDTHKTKESVPEPVVESPNIK